jgi:YD repeat-containing protein
VIRDDDGVWHVHGVGVGGFSEPEDVIDCGNSGTGVRLIMGTMATSPYRGALFNDSLTYYSQITLPHIMNSGATEFNGMASQVWLDAAGSMVEQKGFALTAASSYDSSDQEYREAAPILVDVTNSLAVLASRSATESDFAGKSVEVRTWHDVTEVAGAPYVESASFDEIGRLEQSTDANGTITVYSYDIHDRQTQVRIGTSTLALVTVAEMFYDSNGTTTSGVGDGNVTLQRLHVDGSNHRDTEYRYDNRNRLVWTINELAPHSYTEYDNLGRAVTSHASSVAPTALEAPAQANRIASSSTAYSQRGLAWKSSREIDPTSAPNDDLLVSQQWFDEMGRTIKSQPAGGPGTKVAYDGLGRATHRFAGEMLGESYANIYDTTARKPKVDGDVILEESVTIYGIDPDQRGFSRVVLTKSYQREHNSSSTG